MPWIEANGAALRYDMIVAGPRCGTMFAPQQRPDTVAMHRSGKDGEERKKTFRAV
jgi:hypothetical protein